MDFLIDPAFIKNFKPYGTVAMCLLAVSTYVFKSLNNSDAQEQQDEECMSMNKKKPAGIYNQGNTCFVNSMLQALVPLTCLKQNLDNLLKQSQFKDTNHYELIQELSKVLHKINEQSDSIDVISFLDKISNFSDIINLQQQDAYELYSIIVSALESLENEHKSITMNRSSLSINSANQLEQSFVNCESAQEIAPIQNSLLGFTKSSITCLTCQVQRDIKIHPFFDLSFDISLPQVRTLGNAIKQFQAEQKIEGWACTRCSINSHVAKLRKNRIDLVNNKHLDCRVLERISTQIEQFLQKIVIDESDVSDINEKLGNFVQGFQKEYLQIDDKNPHKDIVFEPISVVERTIVKQCQITKFPKILVVHLKQLSINPITGEPYLLRKRIDFPKELQIKVIKGSKNYKLASLISHSGNQQQGHYFTFRRVNNSEPSWFLISDTQTVECKEHALKAYMPYMLFYEIQE